MDGAARGITHSAILSVLDYLRYLKESSPKSSRLPVVIALLFDGFNYSSEDSCLSFSNSTRLPLIDDSELTLNRLRNFTIVLSEVREEQQFKDFLSKLALMGYFKEYSCGDIGYLKRYMIATYNFKELVSKGRETVALNGLFSGRAQLLSPSSGFSESESSEYSSEQEVELPDVDDILKNATLWDEVNVTLFKPAKQVVIDEITASIDPEVKLIQTTIEDFAKQGPDMKFSFTLFAVAFSTIFIVAANSNVQESPYLFRLLWVLAFAINLITVSIPGRLDRMFINGNHLKPWHSLFEASTWAFAIWSVIYFLQLAVTLYVAFVGLPASLFQLVVPYWLAANWFCALWCYCFRAEFKAHLWVPLLCLLLATGAFIAAHYQITQHMQTQLSTAGKIVALAVRVPMAIHTGWLAAAAFLTLNSWLSVSEATKEMQITIAFTSSFACALLGIFLSCLTFDPVIALTVAWALDAVACRTLEKAHAPQSYVSQDIHESLSITESLLSNTLKTVALGVIIAPLLIQLQVFLPDISVDL